MPAYGPFSREIQLGKVDRRSKEGRLLTQMRKRLADQLGGADKLTPMQLVLVERAALLQLRLAALDQRLIDDNLTDYDAKIYVAWTNSLLRILRSLGVDKLPAAPRRTISDVLADIQHENVKGAAA